MADIERLALYHVKPQGADILTSQGERFDAKAYSKFKYGAGDVAAQYGYDLADLIAQKHEKLLNSDTELVITSSAFKHVPTASYAVAVNMHAAINHALYLRGQEASQNIKIHRHTLLEADYGRMTEAERTVAMQANALSVDREAITGKHLLVVDDIRITGSHERRIEEAVKDLDLLSVWFLYVVMMDAQVAKENPKIEDSMNHAFVRDLGSLADVVATKTFLLNARTCKFILQWNNQDELRSFFASQDNDFLHTLYTGITGDGYGFMSSYKDSLTILEEALKGRRLLIDGRLQPSPVPSGTSRYTQLMDMDALDAIVQSDDEKEPEIQEKTRLLYRDSLVMQQLKSAVAQGQHPTFYTVDPELFGTGLVRDTIEKNGGIYTVVTDKPAELYISEKTRLQSPFFSRPVPKYGIESDTKQRIYVDPALAISPDIVDAPLLVAANGTHIYLLVEKEGTSVYQEDERYRRQLETDPIHWRETIGNILQMIDSDGRIGKVSVVEDMRNYLRGKTRYAPPDFRMLYHISSSYEDPEMDQEERLAERKRENAEKRDTFLMRLQLLKTYYLPYKQLYKTVREAAFGNQEAEKELQQLETLFVHTGIAINRDHDITSHDIENIRVLEKHDAIHGMISLHIIPKNAGEDTAMQWVLRRVGEEIDGLVPQ